MADSKPFLPRTESFLDCTGTLREFHLYQGPQSEGVLVCAQEINPPQVPGYEFEAWSACMGDALGKLRGKIREGISRRYLGDHPQHGLEILARQLAGRIDHSGLVVDGRLLTWEDLIKQLQVTQGFDISIEIKDGSE